jgi:putative hydrolase of the HAD superfamily
MKYKAIFFDADGVVLNNPYQFSDRLEKEYGILHETLQPFFTGVFRECSVGKADLKDELVKVMGDWGWKGTVEELLDFWFKKGTTVDHDVATYISELREDGVRVFLATDQEKYRGVYLRELLGAGQLVEEVFFSAEMGVSKKELSFWETVLEKTGLKKEEVFFTDDDQKKVEAVQGLGIDSCLYTNLDDLKKKLS